MKFSVDLNRCQDHAQCVFAAPRLFSLNSDGRLSLRDEASDEYLSGEIGDTLIDPLEEAAAICPVQAIEIIED